MGLLEKVKKFFYEEDYEEDEDEQEEVKEVKKKEEPIKIQRKERNKKIEQKNEDISERELFKVERTFNFPMDIGIKEEEQEDIEEKQEIEIEKEVEEVIPQRRYSVDRRESAYVGIKNYASTTPSTSVRKEEKQEEKKFKPTPIISPIYGIIDKNKQKEIIEKNEEKYETIKKVDYDTVRKKAYGSAYEEENEEQKGIFFNLNDEKQEEFDNEEEVKIIYNDVNFDEEEKQEIEVTKMEEEKPVFHEEQLEKEEIENNENIENVDEVEEDEEDKILSESNEEDLFNLIDNMYNSDDDEEEDEE